MIQVYSSLVCFSDLKIANQNNSLLITMIIDDSITNSCGLVKDICITMITRVWSIDVPDPDIEDNIMRLNGKFELQLTIEDWVETNESEVRNNMEWTRGNHPEAWIW